MLEEKDEISNMISEKFEVSERKLKSREKNE
jgi:hypothetical protein